MKPKRKLKTILLSLISLLLVAGIGFGAWYFLGSANGDPVFVYEFSYIGMTEYWGDSQESYGPVTTSNIQTIFVSDTQTITEIFVSPGDTVQKGDLLLTFDTTLDDLQLERKRLEVEKLKLRLEDAYDYLYEINTMKPMVIPDFSEESTPSQPEEVNWGTALTAPYQLSTQTALDGSTQELALICWLSDTTSIEDAILDAIRLTAQEYQAKNAATPEESTVPEEDSNIPGAKDEEITPDPEAATTETFYVIFKVTEGNMSLAPTTTWQGLTVHYDLEKQSYHFQFFDASGINDPTIPPVEEEPEPEIDFGSGYTAAQIAEMRSQQEKAIKELEFSIKMSEADYKIMQTEMGDGNVYAAIDGTVVSLLSAEEALLSQQPLMKISGGGGFYVECSVNELSKNELQLGQEVTINDWNTGMVYTGIIDSLGDYPVTADYYSGIGNPNASYYPFTVFVDESADLQEGNYVSVLYDAGTAENGIYLENPFIRTEQGKSYVYLRGENGQLEKRYVTTGKSLWGSYTQILSGLSAEDFIAFPYGKAIQEGAPTQEGDLSDLYNY